MPWLWFFLEYGFDRDSTLKAERLKHCVTERDWNTLQQQSKTAVEELPFGPHWFTRLKARMAADPVYVGAKRYVDMDLPTTTDSGTGAQLAAAEAAHT